MESDEIARRIQHIHDIEIAMDESGEGKTPLTDALRNAIPYMTPEEIRETLFRTLDKLDELYGDRSTTEGMTLTALPGRSVRRTQTPERERMWRR